MQSGFIMAKFHGMPIISHGRWYKKTKQKPGLSTQEKEGKKNDFFVLGTIHLHFNG